MNPNQNNPDTPDTTLSNAPQPSVDPTATPVTEPPAPESPVVAEAVTDLSQVPAVPETPAVAPPQPTLAVDEPVVSGADMPEAAAPATTPSQGAGSDQQSTEPIQGSNLAGAENTVPVPSSAQPDTSQVQETVTEDHGKSFGVIGFVLIAVGVLIGGLVAFFVISNNA